VVFEVVSPERAADALQGKKTGVEPRYSEQGQRLEGLTFPDGKVWLIDGNIEKGQAAGVLAHELGVHARKLGFKDEKSFNAILNRIEVLGKTDKDVQAAFIFGVRRPSAQPYLPSMVRTEKVSIPEDKLELGQYREVYSCRHRCTSTGSWRSQ
jgi:hypothetical protein